MISRAILLRLCLAAAFSLSPAQPQFQSSMQANSREEYDAYLEVLAAQTAESRLIAAGKFEREWSSSEMLAHVYALEMEAYRDLGDADKAVAAGERAIEAEPGNLPVLAAVANMLPNGPAEPADLEKAERYAARILAGVQTVRVPKTVRPEEWEMLESTLKSQAHSALGLVAAKRKDLQTAVREFETAVSLAPTPDPTQHYRLGRLYLTLGKREAAAEQFRQAAASKQPGVAALAEDALQELQSAP